MTPRTASFSLRRRLGIGLALGVVGLWLAAAVVAGLLLKR